MILLKALTLTVATVLAASGAAFSAEPAPASGETQTTVPSEIEITLSGQELRTILAYAARGDIHLTLPDGSMHPLVDGAELSKFLNERIANAQRQASAKAATAAEAARKAADEKAAADKAAKAAVPADH